MNSNQRSLLSLACMSHALCHAFMLIFPVILVSLKNEYEFTFLGVGTLGMIAYFFFGIGSLPAGLLIDKVGPKKMLNIGLFGMSLSALAIGTFDSITYLMISMFFIGCFASIHHPAALAMISMSFRERKGKAFGLHALAGSIGIATAPVITAAILTQLDWRFPYLIFAAVGLVTSVFSINLNTSAVLDRRAPESQKRLDNPLSRNSGWHFHVTFFLICLSSALFGLIYRGMLTYLPTLFDQQFAGPHLDKNIIWVGSLITLVLGVGGIGQYYGGVISDRLKVKEYGTFCALFLSAPILVGIGTLQGVSVFILMGALSLLVFTYQPIQNHIIAEATVQRRRGISYGINYGVLFGFGAVASAIGGWFTDQYSVNFFYTFLGGIAIIAAFLVALQAVIRLKLCKEVDNSLETSPTTKFSTLW